MNKKTSSWRRKIIPKTQDGNNVNKQYITKVQFWTLNVIVLKSKAKSTVRLKFTKELFENTCQDIYFWTGNLLLLVRDSKNYKKYFARIKDNFQKAINLHIYIYIWCFIHNILNFGYKNMTIIQYFKIKKQVTTLIIIINKSYYVKD